MLYVDHMRIPYGRMLMNHLMADTSEELEGARQSLGLPEGTIQHRGTAKEHLDICESKRRQILVMGAISIDARGLVGIVQRKRVMND